MNLTALHDRAARRAPRHVVLKPSDFADTWADKPSTEVAVGIRLLSENDYQTAKAEASRVVERLYTANDGGLRDHEKAAEAWDDALICWVVAIGTCNVNDVQASYFPYANDVITLALTSRAIQRIYDAIDLLHLEESPATHEATDEELVALGEALAKGAEVLSSLKRIEARRARRLLGHAFATLLPPPP